MLMTMTDPIADMLTRLRNGIMARHTHVLVPGSKLKMEVLRILKEEGYIEGFEVVEEEPYPVIRVALKYGEDREPVLSGLRRVSKPGLRIYAGKGEIPRVMGGLGTVILSTSAGVMTGREAWKRKIGGEVLCYVW
jgi:small subunit ribosomal protein S8